MTRRKMQGEFLLACALGGVLAGTGAAFMASDVGSRMSTLRENGVVSAAQITGKQSRESRETKVIGGGRRVSQHTTDYTLSLRFDLHAATPHRDFVTGAVLKSNSEPLPFPTSIDVSRQVYDTHNEGGTIMVTFLPDVASYDKDSFQLTETVEQQSSFGFLIWWYLGAATSLAFAAWGVRRFMQLNRPDA